MSRDLITMGSHSNSVKKVRQAKYGVSHVKSVFGHLFVYMSVDLDYVRRVLVVLAVSNLATSKPGLRCFPPSHIILSVPHWICSLSTRLWLNHEISSKFRKQSSTTSDCFHYASDSSPAVPILYKPFIRKIKDQLILLILLRAQLRRVSKISSFFCLKF
jgi:hypothetical protein